MVQCMRRLAKWEPEVVELLAKEGPYDEPNCAVCSVLLGQKHSPPPAFHAAVEIMMYHDEATYDVDDPEDYMMATGLAGIFVYQRCLKVYAAARSALSLNPN